MKKSNIFRAARIKAGFPATSRKEEVVQHVCAALNVPIPPTWTLRYHLLREWIGAPVPNKTPKKACVVVMPATVKGESKRKRRAAEQALQDDFLLTYEWRRLRMEVIVERGKRCECCGATPQPGNDVVINVDHIKPRRKFPELALAKSNLQILCGACNHGKGNWDETDWRDESKA